MSESTSSSSDPFASALGNLGGIADPRSKDPNFKMRQSSVRTLGTNVSGYGDGLSELSTSTRNIDIHPFAFGAIGGGLNVAHRSVRDSAAEALKQAKEVLDSWKEALTTAADNTEQAEEASKTQKNIPQPKIPGGGAGKLGPMGGIGKPSGLGDLGKPGGIDPNDLGMDKPSLDKPSIDQPSMDQPSIDQPSLEKPDTGDLERPDLTNPDLGGVQQPDLKNPDLSGVNQPNLNTPDLSGVDKPKTDLAGVDPNLPTATTPQIRTPDATAYDPRTSVPRTSTGYPEGGLGAGSSTPGPGLGAQGSIARALNTGTPIYPPPMGGAGAANNDDKDRERGPSAGEDEAVWFGDEEYAPAVLGKEEG